MISGEEIERVISRRVLLAGGAVLASASSLSFTRAAFAKDPKEMQFALAIPFGGLESYQRIVAGYKDAVAKLGGTLTIADANFDVKKQSDQIAAFVASKPDALIVLPADPAGVSKAVQAATAAGVLTLLCDSYVPGATVASISMPDNYGMGLVASQYVCSRLGGKGKIATMTLPENEGWNMRTEALNYVLSRYPDIEVVANWAFDASGKVTPRDAADSMLAAHKEIQAIWTSWDGAAKEAALAIRATGRSDVFTTGMDGGKQSFEYIKSGSPFCYTVAQTFYQEAFFNIYYAHKILAGGQAPRIIINPAYEVTQDALKSGIPDDYDHFGVADKLGWKRV
jgi:ribose transport system substrate-binding protein